MKGHLAASGDSEGVWAGSVNPAPPGSFACPGRAISAFTRVFDALWRDRDPGAKNSRNSTAHRPWILALAPATPPLRPGHTRLSEAVSPCRQRSLGWRPSARPTRIARERRGLVHEPEGAACRSQA